MRVQGVFHGLVIGIYSFGAAGETVALWLFDEQTGLYPSSILTDSGPNDDSLVLGRRVRIVKGKFGNA
jgi:hypothetical protein